MWNHLTISDLFYFTQHCDCEIIHCEDIILIIELLIF